LITTTQTPPPVSSRVERELQALAELPRLSTAQEIAEALGLPIQSVYGFTREGCLPAIRFGRMIRYNPAEILAFLKQGGTSVGGGR
jgi:excisionase family DNA binding protein